MWQLLLLCSGLVAVIVLVPYVDVLQQPELPADVFRDIESLLRVTVPNEAIGIRVRYQRAQHRQDLSLIHI